MGGELPLKILFPELYNIACNKDAWVEENMGISNGLIHWNVLFIRPVRGWEIDVVSRFFELLYSHKLRYGGEDKICWVLSKRKIFEVKSYYQVLSTPAWVFGPWKSIWKVKAPLRVAFFVLRAALGTIITFGQFTEDEYYGDGVVLHV